jgi:hypothetical protein
MFNKLYTRKAVKISGITKEIANKLNLTYK